MYILARVASVLSESAMVRSLVVDLHSCSVAARGSCLDGEERKSEREEMEIDGIV